ncbi:hypothetical protein HYE67_004403 [Fusarium culmorum]|uniref:Uncharacterized protein n=1 Tax=Fusarium culmorum TaxID=5516 RepID=A0A2T4GJY6_FUSCU|nr:hypothetical protein FCULG_00001683 [Fusarium culmorum]QPC62172.1 hypothetical protein HYE67_004403 [Fusarium culmorum]
MYTKHQVPWRTTFTTIALLLISFFLLSYTSSHPRLSLSPRTVAADGDQLQQHAAGGLTKRVTDTYSKAHDKGHWLHCRMSMTKEEAKESNRGKSLESPSYLQVNGLEEPEGWNPHDASVSQFGDDLNEALRSLSIPIDFHHESWVHVHEADIFNDPSWLIDGSDGNIDDFENCIPTGAFFHNSFIAEAGVIIADNNYAVDPALLANAMNPNDLATHIRKWSDAVWMQWWKVCHEKGEDVKNVKYIIRSKINNGETLNFIFQAIVNKHARDAKGKTIGTWDNRITMTIKEDPDELYGILGSPNGAGAAYLLLNHKERLGLKIINKVDIFVAEGSHEVKGIAVDKDTPETITLLFHVTDV